jgi:hypothetical protein
MIERCQLQITSGASPAHRLELGFEQIFDRLIAPDPFMNCPLYELGHILSKIPSAGHSFQNLLVWLATSYSEMVRQAVEATWAMALHRNIGAPGANASRPKQ